MIRADGEPIDVLSASGRSNLEADKTAFVALMRHLKEIDTDDHTVITVQVENESGGVGTLRDFSPEVNEVFAGQVPADLLYRPQKTRHMVPGLRLRSRRNLPGLPPGQVHQRNRRRRQSRIRHPMLCQCLD